MSSDNSIIADVVGVGPMGRHPAGEYGGPHDVHLVGVYDTDTDRADAIAQKNGFEGRSLEAVTDLSEGVSMPVPPTYHYDLEYIHKQARYAYFDVDLSSPKQVPDHVLTNRVHPGISDDGVTTIISTNHEFQT